MKTPQMQSLVATAADARSSLYIALQPGQQQEQEPQQSKNSCSAAAGAQPCFAVIPALAAGQATQQQQLLPMPKDNPRVDASTN